VTGILAIPTVFGVDCRRHRLTRKGYWGQVCIHDSFTPTEQVDKPFAGSKSTAPFL
jgi:hypothetical protein